MPPTPCTPSTPWVVVSTDWVCTEKVTQEAIPGDPQTATTRCVTYNANGVFRNTGQPSSAAVRFTVHVFPDQVICTAAIPQTATNGVSEASCQASMPVNTYMATTPPDATVT
jgi:hypothetical protein